MHTIFSTYFLTAHSRTEPWSLGLRFHALRLPVPASLADQPDSSDCSVFHPVRRNDSLPEATFLLPSAFAARLYDSGLAMRAS